jgi:hypothetical protein
MNSRRIDKEYPGPSGIEPRAGDNRMGNERYFEWLLGSLYPSVAEFLAYPDKRNEAKLKAEIARYRKEWHAYHKRTSADEHEWAMNYRW